MPNAKDWHPADHGVMAGVAGPPGSGKSEMIARMADIGPTAVAITDAAELDLYGGRDIEYELFLDPDWQPSAEKFAAKDFTRLLKWIDETSMREDIRCIGVDHMSGGTTSPGVSELAMHDTLKMHKIGNPLDLAHGQAYLGHANGMRDFLHALRVASLRGKHVLVATLVQLRESDTAPKAGGTEFEVQLLPAVHGNIRQHISASFSLYMHSYAVGKQCFVTAMPSKVRPAKKRMKFKAGTNEMRLPNDLKEILGLIE